MPVAHMQAVEDNLQDGLGPGRAIHRQCRAARFQSMPLRQVCQYPVNHTRWIIAARTQQSGLTLCECETAVSVQRRA